MKVIVSKRDIVIPKGTVFKCIDGTTRNYLNGNYEALIDLSKDNCGNFTIGTYFDEDNFEYADQP